MSFYRMRPRNVFLCGCVALCFTQASASAARSVPLVIRGDRVEESDPVARSSVLVDVAGSLCSGTVIAHDIVVTAAHCVDSKPYTKHLNVFFGKNRSSGQKVRVANYVAMRYDDEIEERDLALLLLKDPIPRGFGTALVMRDSSVLKVGQDVIVAGYGNYTPDHKKDGSLHKGTSRITKHTKNEVELTGTNDSPTGQGGCLGDSGGSVYYQKGQKLFFFGVISRGDSKCEEVGVVGRLDAHRDWVDRSIEKLRSGKISPPGGTGNGGEESGQEDSEESDDSGWEEM
jgi:secreted trypsin-like serine protease